MINLKWKLKMKLFRKNIYFITIDRTNTINGIFKYHSDATAFKKKCQCDSIIRTTRKTVLGYYIIKIASFLF